MAHHRIILGQACFAIYRGVIPSLHGAEAMVEDTGFPQCVMAKFSYVPEAYKFECELNDNLPKLDDGRQHIFCRDAFEIFNAIC